MSLPARRLTYADYERIPADGLRHEILCGNELVTPAPTPDHQSLVVKLTTRIASHAATRGLGQVFVAPIDVLLSEHDLVQPDVLFVARARLQIVGPKNIQGAPDLVIEVLSPSTESIDRVQKRDLYQRSGVREYWLVDAEHRSVEIHEFDPSPRTRLFQEGQSFESALLPQLLIVLADLF